MRAKLNNAQISLQKQTSVMSAKAFSIFMKVETFSPFVYASWACIKMEGVALKSSLCPPGYTLCVWYSKGQACPTGRRNIQHSTNGFEPAAHHTTTLLSHWIYVLLLGQVHPRLYGELLNWASLLQFPTDTVLPVRCCSGMCRGQGVEQLPFLTWGWAITVP